MFSPKKPNGIVHGGLVFFDEADAPPSSTRAPHYSSSRKPQIAFNQVRSSVSPKNAASQAEETAVKEEKPQPAAAKSEGGFFSIISNFFSYTKTTPQEETKQAATVKEEDFVKAAKEEFKGRKSSKSMQVMQQPASISFQKPLDMKEVAKIKNLAVGLSLIKKLSEKADEQGNRDGLSVSMQGPLAAISPGTQKFTASATDYFAMSSSRQKDTYQTQPPHMRQETATFSADKHPEPAAHEKSRQDMGKLDREPKRTIVSRDLEKTSCEPGG